jgi:hypothetical protein
MTSKLGLHIIEPYREKAYDARICAAAPRIIKVVGNPEEVCVLAHYEQCLRGRNVTYIARVFDWDKEVSDIFAMHGTPVQAANVMIQHLKYWVPKMGLDFVYFECGPNEPGDDAIDWLNEYYTYVVTALAARDIKTCAFNFSVCHPPLDFWQRLANALRAIRNAGPELAIIGLHQYGLFGRMQEHAADGNDARVLRHRCIPEIKGIKVAGTEGGLDEPGWRRCKNVEQYTGDLMWLDAELKKDPDMLGMALFTMNREVWQDFNLVGGVADNLFCYWEKENAGSIIEVPPPPEPEPAHEPQVRVFNCGSLNVRTGPGTSYPKAPLAAGTEVKVLGHTGDWVQIETFVHEKYLEEK